MMKILHLATQDLAGGGGGFDSAYSLHRNMRTAGIDSRMVVMAKLGDDPYVANVMNHLTFTDRLRLRWCAARDRYLRRKFRPFDYFIEISQEKITASRLLAIHPFQPDVIIAHWVSNFVTARTLRDLNRTTHAPILWYFMDMAPLTGGCHYAFDCTGYTKQCGNCPQLGAGTSAKDLSHRQWCRKQASLQETNITAIVGSTWLMRQAMESSLFSGRPIKQILLGMDVEVFKPVTQMTARVILGLPHDRKIIFFGAQNFFEERKGVVYLVDALNQLYSLLESNPDMRSNILVVTAGSGKNADQLHIPFEHRHVGFLQGNDKLAAAYQSADVFVNASIEDSGPMMINESILCGTPVVSFDMGVARDLVHTGLTGYRARLKDSSDMAIGLLRILEMDDKTTQAMRMECRTLGVQFCHPDVQVRAFASLCSELIASSRIGD